MHPCEGGYPCPYMTMVSDTKAKCQHATCALTRHGDDVYDRLTDTWHDWTWVKRGDKPAMQAKKKRNDDWYDDWLEKNGFGGYKDMMEHNEVGTHERHRGARRQKRVR